MVISTTISATEFCNGTCNDAEVYHGSMDERNECTDHCRINRYDGRCHCGRKYTPAAPTIDDNLRLKATTYIQEAITAREDMADALNLDHHKILVVVSEVEPELFDALDVPLYPDFSPPRKKLRLTDDDFGISFWRSMRV